MAALIYPQEPFPDVGKGVHPDDQWLPSDQEHGLENQQLVPPPCVTRPPGGAPPSTPHREGGASREEQPPPDGTVLVLSAMGHPALVLPHTF